MKKLLGYIGAWSLYHIGNSAANFSKYIPDNEFIWEIYDWSMNASIDIQDWAGNKTPWLDVNPAHAPDIHEEEINETIL
jgi:hypothetical protein